MPGKMTDSPLSAAMAAAALELGERFAPLVGDFPDPVLVTDTRGKVVYVNKAAGEFFGRSLHLGDPCPICSHFADLFPEESHRHCPRLGESLNRLPVVLRDHRGLEVSLTASATAVKTDGQPSGCFIVLRNLQADLLANRVVQMQRATLTSILENFPNPFFMVDPDLTITHMNDLMEKMTGYSRAEVVGKMTCGAILNTVQCGTEACVLRQVMDTKRPISQERRTVRDRQGREIPVEVSASLITDHTGKVVGGFESVRDITQRVEAQKKVDLLTELTREAILMVDEDQRIIFVNSKAAEVIELSKEELLGRDIGEVLSPQHRRSVAELARMVREGYAWDLQFCGTLDPSSTSKGERRVFETSMAASRLGDQVITYVYLRDLSYRVKIGRELHKNLTFLNNIIQCSVDGIVVVETKGVPLIFNEGAERILGYQSEEVIGHPEVFRRFYPPKLAQEIMRRLRSPEYGPVDKLPTTQINFVSKSGEEVPVLFSAAILREHGREVGSVGIFSDLREIVKMRKELEDSQTQLMQAEKIASLGRLSAGVAHEINNPLAGILIYAELLQREMPQDAAIREYVNEIVNQTMRCQQIVQRLLEFSRQSLGQRTLFNINQIIARCVALVQHQPLFHNIEINLDLDPELPQINGDPGQLQQVFTNLLLNAVDAMDGRGVVGITSRPQPRGEGVVITLSDTGPGIPPEIQQKIFEPFFTTKAPGKGTGLGLSIVYSVIQRHAGAIEVDSAPGRGTTFTLRLPLDIPESMAQFESVGEEFFLVQD